jgi:hypothetical protein
MLLSFGVLRPSLRYTRNFTSPASRPSHKARNLRKTRPIMDPRQLSYGDGPMVWVDCEMTGLDPDKDKILEIAVSAFFSVLGCWYLVLTVLGSHHQWEP